MNIQIEEIHRARPVGRAVELQSSPWVNHSSSTSNSPAPKLPEPHSFGIFVEASSCEDDLSLTHFPTLLLFLEVREWGWKSQAFKYGLVFSVTSPHLGAHHVWPHKNKMWSYHPGNAKGFRNPVSETSAKAQILEQNMLYRPWMLHILLPCRKIRRF